MAFTKTKLTIIANSQKMGVKPALWAYDNDANDSIIAADFFAEPHLTVGDQIMVYNGGDNSSPLLYRVSAKSTDGFTATVVLSDTAYIFSAPPETATAVTEFYDTLSLNNELSYLVSTAAVITDVYTANPDNDVITAATKNLTNGMKVQVTTTTTQPGGLSLLTDYYTINASGKTAQLSATLGGAAIDITDDGTGVQTLAGQENNFVLPDGAEGQRKLIKFLTDGTLDAVVIPDNLQDGTTITFGTAMESVSLVFAGGNWQIVANDGGTVA